MTDTTDTMEGSAINKRRFRDNYYVAGTFVDGIFVISFPIYSDELVGRHEELAFLMTRLHDVMHGASSIALIRGEAGIGKSRLLQEFRKAILQKSALFYAGSCLEYAQSPYTAVIDALSPLFDKEPRALGEEASTTLAETRLRAFESHSFPVADTEKLEYFASFAERIAHHSKAKPIVLAIENLQWADAGTLDLIEYLAANGRAARLFLLLTFRSEVLRDGNSFVTLIPKLAREGAVSLELRPLSDGDMIYLERNLLRNRPLLSRESLEQIRDLAEGNPLFAEELTRGALDAKAHRGDYLDGTPLSIRTVIQKRLRRFTKKERNLLMQAAVLGRSFDAEFLASIVGCPMGDLLTVLRHARNAQLIVEHPDVTDRFSFRHAMIREIVYRELLIAERIRLHAKIAASVEAVAGADHKLAELAYHWAEAGHAAKAAHYAEKAGDLAVEVYGFGDASRFYRRALYFIPNKGSRRARLCEKLGFSLMASGSSEAITWLERAISEYRRIGHTEKMARMLLSIARQNLINGKTEESLRTASHALDVLRESSNTSTRLVARVHMARYSTLLSRSEEALEYLEPPVSEHASPDVAAAFYDVRGLAYANVGKGTEAFSDFERSIKLAAVTKDPETLVLALNNCAFSASWMGKNKLALRCYDRALDVARERGLVARTAFVSFSFARTCLRLGRLRPARELVDFALSASVEANVNRFIAAEVGIPLGLFLGNEALVRRCSAEEVLELALQSGESERIGPVISSYAELWRGSGRADEASALLHRGLGMLSSADQCWWMLTRVPAWGNAGDIDRARVLLEQSVERYQLYVAKVHLALFDAYVARRESNDAEANVRAKAASVGFGRLRWPYHMAQALELADESAQALSIYRQIGDVRDARRIELAVAAANRRGKPNTALTPREAEVAELVAKGETNRAIGEQLNISEHTVIHHLESIFNRLGIRSRSQLAAHIAGTRRGVA